MAWKFLTLDGLKTVLREAIIASTGAADAGKIAALDAAGKWDASMMPTGVGADTKAYPASENLAGGDYVNIFDDAGTWKIRKADGSDPAKFASGFVLAAVTSGSNDTVYFEGDNTSVSGLSPGLVWLSDATPGAVVQTPPTAAGSIIQVLGTATSATSVNTEIAVAIEVE